MEDRFLIPGITTNNERLLGWLASVVEPAREEFEVRLSHLGDEGERVVRTYRGRPDMDSEDITNMVGTFEQVAADDAEHLPGAHPQRYQLSALAARGDQLASTMFKVTARFRPSSMLPDLEDPTAKGLTSMAMRFAEQNHQGLFGLIFTLVESLSRRQAHSDVMVERLQERIMKGIEDRANDAARLEEREAARDERRRQAELDGLAKIQDIKRSEKLTKMATDNLDLLVPVLVAKLSDHIGSGSPAAVADGIGAALGRSFTDDELAKLRTFLRPAQVAAFEQLRQHGHTPASTIPPARTAATPATPSPSSPSTASPEQTTAGPDAPLRPEAIRSGLMFLRRGLLPWAAERIAKGESADPTEHRPEEATLLSRILMSLSPAEYDIITSNSDVMSPEERQTLKTMVVQILSPKS